MDAGRSDVSRTEKSTEPTDSFQNRTEGFKKNWTDSQTDRPSNRNFQLFTRKIDIS